MFEIKPCKLAGCLELQPRVFEDARGRFVKVFHEEAFRAQGLETGFVEEYYSSSHRHVVRGLHFQLPPQDHVKLVYCVHGAVMDVVLDLRVGSPTYGEYASFELSADRANSLYIPRGMAHGFCALSDDAIMVYKVSSVYSAEHDAGILWNSLDIPWPTSVPIVSARDQFFPALADFASPFRYE
ncbi:MAG: dTDP-4-dehydrorhamnose 3,5-epimerase [Nitrosomonadales bacterium]|nr:dTDP-4-dehydrorhamnose 3,5-epimerase [Nitrosomonadales bacterium]